MKFLGWTHRKLKQESTKPLKNYVIGHEPRRKSSRMDRESCLGFLKQMKSNEENGVERVCRNPSSCFSVHSLVDEENYYVGNTKTSICPNLEFQRSSKRAQASKIEDFSQEELYESFEFLKIGTFGMELLNTDPPTPTLSMPLENFNSQYKEITDNNLKLIRYELEKFFEAEDKENTIDPSERTSQASIITLSNEPTDEEYSDGHMHVAACPLKNYLFASSIEVAETDKELKKEKISLKELFMRSNIVNDDDKMECEGAELQHRKRNGARFIKKVLNKLCFSSSSPTSSSKDAAAVPISTKKKLCKAVEILHRKVHPEEITNEQCGKRTNDLKKHYSCRTGCLKNIGTHDECKMVAEAACKKSENSSTGLTANCIYKGAPMISEGHWIGTDSDYFVLELEEAKF